MRAEREDKIARRKEALDAQRKARAKRMREYRERMKAEGKGKAEGKTEGNGGSAPPPPPQSTSPPPCLHADSPEHWAHGVNPPSGAALLGADALASMTAAMTRMQEEIARLRAGREDF